MKKEQIPLFNQLIESMKEAEEILERAYEKKDHDKFNKAKKYIMEAHKKMIKLLK